MKLEKTVEIPNQKDIDVSLTLGEEKLEFTLKTKSKVNQESLDTLDKEMQVQEEAPRRYAEVVELISISKSFIESHEKKIEKEKKKKEQDLEKIESLFEKREKELRTLRPLLLERDKVGSTPYKVEEIFEKRVKLFCVEGLDSLEKHAELFSWRETAYLVGSLLLEAEGKK